MSSVFFRTYVLMWLLRCVIFGSLGKETCDLLDKLLTLDPRERITASAALDHEYFWSDPLPADPKRYVLLSSSTQRTTKS